MKIKNVRKPTSEEKSNIIPGLILFGTTTAILTVMFYFMDFHFIELGESMYLPQKVISSKDIAEHNLIIKLFEAIYKRDYMTNRFEGLSISLVASIIMEVTVAIGLKVYGFTKEHK